MLSVIKEVRYLPSRALNALSFVYRKVKVGKRFSSRGLLHVYGHGNLLIGDNVRINSCRFANPIGGDVACIFHTFDSGTIRIGNGTGISNSSFLARDCIQIGENVRIGGSCKFYDNDFHSLNFEERINGFKNIKTAPIVVEDGAFIGAHSIILKGTRIGKYSVVGAGSVVTKNIPDYEIWAGNPAKKIGEVEHR